VSWRVTDEDEDDDEDDLVRDEDDLRECVRPLAKGLGANISARFSAAAAAFARFCAHVTSRVLCYECGDYHLDALDPLSCKLPFLMWSVACRRATRVMASSPTFLLAATLRAPITLAPALRVSTAFFFFVIFGGSPLWGGGTFPESVLFGVRAPLELPEDRVLIESPPSILLESVLCLYCCEMCSFIQEVLFLRHLLFFLKGVF
jgi:hypothetical protein